jgi:hypothetical protein
MMRKIDMEKGRMTYEKRLVMIEPVFANIRTHKRLDRFTLRGKIMVNIQWCCIAWCIISEGWQGRGMDVQLPEETQGMNWHRPPMVKLLPRHHPSITQKDPLHHHLPKEVVFQQSRYVSS